MIVFQIFFFTKSLKILFKSVRVQIRFLAAQLLTSIYVQFIYFGKNEANFSFVQQEGEGHEKSETFLFV